MAMDYFGTDNVVGGEVAPATDANTGSAPAVMPRPSAPVAPSPMAVAGGQGAQAPQAPDPAQIKDRLLKEKPAIMNEISNPDLPYAKAAAWNAFFTGLVKGPDQAIVDFGNTYAKSIAKFADAEAQYNSSRAILKKGYDDTLSMRVNDFESEDPFVRNVVRNSAGDLATLKALAERARAQSSPDAGKLEQLIKNLEDDKRNFSDNLISLAGGMGGKVKNVKEINGLDKDGNSVQQLITTLENGKTKVTYIDAQGNQSTKPPAGFQTESAIKAVEDRLSKERTAKEAIEQRREAAEQRTLLATIAQNASLGTRELQQDRLRQQIADTAEKRQSEINNAVNNADRGMAQIEQVRKHKGRSVLGAYDVTRMVPGSDSYDFVQSIQQLKSGAFLQGIQQMRGLGALSNAEGAKVESAIANLNPNMSKKAFEEELDKIQKSLKIMKEDALKRQQVPYPGMTGATATGGVQASGGTAPPRTVEVNGKKVTITEIN